MSIYSQKMLDGRHIKTWSPEGLADYCRRYNVRWIVAWTGLSAAWFLGDGDAAGAAIDREINQVAAGLLGI